MRLYIFFAEYRRKSGKKVAASFTVAAKDIADAERLGLARFEREAQTLKGFSHIIGIRAVYFADQIKTK